jgi:hypothetical protein
MLNPKQAHLTEHDLKKQSQFAAARTGAKSFVKGDYGNKWACGAKKNKPNKANFEKNQGRRVIQRYPDSGT